MKRTIFATVEVSAYVDLPIDGEEQPTADPAGEISDGEAAETAILSAIGQITDVFVYGEDVEPARVFIDDIQIRIEGEE